ETVAAEPSDGHGQCLPQQRLGLAIACAAAVNLGRLRQRADTALLPAKTVLPLCGCAEHVQLALHLFARYRIRAARSRTSGSLWLAASLGAIRSSSLMIRNWCFLAPLCGFAALGLAFAGSRTSVSLWLAASLGAIRSSSLTIRSFGFRFSVRTAAALCP